MTRKDYETIAASLKAATKTAIYNSNGPDGYGARTQFALTCNEVAGRLKAGNELFDRNRFLTACGLDGATVEAL